MVKTLVFTLLSFLISFSAYCKTCSIKTHAKIYLSGENKFISYNKLIKKSNCSKLINAKFAQIISTSNGNINTQLLSNHLNSAKTSVIVAPARVKVMQLNLEMKKNFSLSSRFFFTSTKFIRGQKVITLSRGQQLEFSCANCTLPGPKEISISVYDSLSGQKKIHWLSSKLMVKAMALVSQRDLGITYGGLAPLQFLSKEILTDKPERLFTNLKKVVFYKINKPLAKGQPLLFQDLSPLNLVRSGQPVNVTLRANGIQLSSKAISIRSGKLGEIIQLKNVSNNKIIIGKIIGFNKVLVQL